MAHIVPSDISRLALAGVRNMELDTLKILKDGLPQDYTVFHGVHWSREYEGWSHFGEIDFVVLHRSGKLLLIEQKNGVLEESDKGLIKHYGDREKNPEDQIYRSLDKVRDKFHWQHGRDERLSLDYLIYCPDYKVKQVNAVALAPSRIVDGGAQDGLVKRIESLLGTGTPCTEDWYQKIEGFFRQTFELVPDIHAHIEAGDKQFVRQSGALVKVIENMEIEPYRLRVSGTAGSGKSQLARSFFAKAVRQGKHPLLVCFNRPLAERLKARVGEGGHTNTFYGFCHAFLEDCGQTLDFSSMSSDPDFWTKIQERVTGEDIPQAWKFDTLIVDEGQDFEGEWLEILKLFINDEGDILWLEDPDQNLQGKPPIETAGFVHYRSPVNYRSPESIIRFIRNTLPFSFESGNDLPGLGVKVHTFSRTSDQPRIVGKIIIELMRAGFSQEDIVLLTYLGRASSIFDSMEKVGGLSLRKYTGKYDSNGNQILSRGRLTFESIYRFKGQQSPAVILVDVDPNPERLLDYQRRLYCSLTRATVRTDMLVNEENPETLPFRRVRIP